MKIRHGFVSNSSSSSFVCVVLQDTYDKELEKMSPLFQAIVEYTMESDNVFGKDCMIFSKWSSNDGESRWSYDLEFDEIIVRAKELADKRGVPIATKEEYSDYNNLDDYLRAAIKSKIYGVSRHWEKLKKPKEIWSYSQDW